MGPRRTDGEPPAKRPPIGECLFRIGVVSAQRAFRNREPDVKKEVRYDLVLLRGHYVPMDNPMIVIPAVSCKDKDKTRHLIKAERRPEVL